MLKSNAMSYILHNQKIIRNKKHKAGDQKWHS